MPLEDLLRQRFANFRAIYLPTAARLAGHGFELLPTGQRPHFTIRLRRASDAELDRLLDCGGVVRPWGRPPAHRRAPRGSKDEAAASFSNNSRSSSDGCLGTVICTTA